MQLTILTPTFNRADTLKELFHSLQEQTCKDFLWLVVDDGSTDNTKEEVSCFCEVSDFPIQYIYKENGGKHTALNEGIGHIDSPLTFIVDSDDQLTNDAVETVLSFYQKQKTEEKVCGYSFLRMFPDGTINGKRFPNDEWKCSLIESRINTKDIYSDKAEVYFTSVLKQFPFPEYPGEKFLGEDLVWIRIAKQYEMIHVNKPIYISEYLPEGLTSNRRKHNIQSPVGCMNRALEYMSPSILFEYRCKGAIQYIVYGKFAKQTVSQLMRNTTDKVLTIVFLIPGLVLYRFWKRKYT